MTLKGRRFIYILLRLCGNGRIQSLFKSFQGRHYVNPKFWGRPPI